MEAVKHSVLHLFLLMWVISTSVWFQSEARGNIQIYDPREVLQSRRMLLEAESEAKTNAMETDLILPEGSDHGNLATTETEMAQSELRQEDREKTSDDTKKKKEKENTMATSVEASKGGILVDTTSSKVGDEMLDTLETEGGEKPTSEGGEKPKSEGSDGENVKKTQLPSDANKGSQPKEKSKDETFDVEMEVNLGLDPDSKAKEVGEKGASDTVVDSESTNVMGSQRREEEKEKEEEEEKEKEKEKEIELVQPDEEVKLQETEKKEDESSNRDKDMEKGSTDAHAHSNSDGRIKSSTTQVKELAAIGEDEVNNKEKAKEKDSGKEPVDTEDLEPTRDEVSSDEREEESNKKEMAVKVSTIKEKEAQKEDPSVLTKGTETRETHEPKTVRKDEDMGGDDDGDGDDDEYGDFMQDFVDLPSKFQDTAKKVADHLSPNIYKLTDRSKTYFNKANQQITESFSPLVGKQVAPFFGTLVSFSLLLLPLAIVALLFDHIRAVLSLQKILLFINVYLSAYFATLLFATFVLGEPMMFFYKSSANGYIHLQLFQAFGYVVYLILQTFDLVHSLSSEALLVKVTVVLQWVVACTVGFHYYVTIFHRAMASKGPHTSWKIYGMYSLAFLVLCLFARIQRTKKSYSQVGNDDLDKTS